MDSDDERWRPEEVAPPMLSDEGQDLLLAPLRTTTYTRHGMTIIASQPRPTHTSTTYTLNNTTPEEAPEMTSTDMYADREAHEKMGLIQSWLSGHAPGSTHVPLDAIAQHKAIAKYGPERGRLDINKRNAANAFRKVVVERCAKDEFTMLKEMTVVVNTDEYIPESIAWLNTDTQIRFFGLTDLDTGIPTLAGHPVEVVAVRFEPLVTRKFIDRDGYERLIPKDWAPANYVEIVGCWEHAVDADIAREELCEAIRAQIQAGRTAERDDDTDTEYDEDGEVRRYYAPVDVFGSA